SAHSYDSVSRRWNFSNNKKYMEGMHSGSEYYETELLTADNRYNEFIMTSLRTVKGVNYLKLEEQFGKEKAQFFKSKIQKYIDSGHIKIEQEVYKLSGEGIFIADHVIAGVFA
ncbi:MAG: coproporphyrinogen III oxidase, partial [Candidatus Paceibacterota bacterium]